MMRFLFVDRILGLEEGQWVKGIKHITADDPFLIHEPNCPPYFTPSLIGETLGQLAAWNAMKTLDFKYRPVAGILERATLGQPAYLGQTLYLESFIDNLDPSAVAYHSQASIDGEVVFTLEGALGPMLPMDTFIDEATIRRQFDQINRPGELPPRFSSPVPDLPSLGQRPQPATPWMQFDRLLSLAPKESLQAEKRISFAAPYFPDHFPHHPVLPLTILLECKHALAKTFLAASDFHDYRLTSLARIKMKSFIHPGDVIVSTLKLKSVSEEEIILNLQTQCDNKRICTVDMTFTPSRSSPCKNDV